MSFIWFYRFLFLFLCIFVPNICCGVLKVLIGRSRPKLFFLKGLYGIYGLKFDKFFWSFPSSHVTTIISITLGISTIYPYFFYVLIFFAFIVSLSRVLLMQHYLTDILITIYITFLEVNFFIYIFKKKIFY
ncbi:phosphatase PAP2 family protein [Candidatus Legionella polyplacis]|uniref:Phosphatase PAP2 family protein n=1 Tax=Candidatus Legionella polyplacis TaxID=2005262 RepID=A0ABZ2GZR5_9GAMM